LAHQEAVSSLEVSGLRFWALGDGAAVPPVERQRVLIAIRMGTRPLIDRDRKLPKHCVVTLRLQEERFEICWADADRIQHADMTQLAARAEGVDGFGRYREMCSDVPYTQ